MKKLSIFLITPKKGKAYNVVLCVTNAGKSFLRKFVNYSDLSDMTDLENNYSEHNYDFLQLIFKKLKAFFLFPQHCSVQGSIIQFHPTYLVLETRQYLSFKVKGKEDSLSVVTE